MDFLTNITLKKSTLTKNELKACEAICKDLKMVQKLTLNEMSKEIKTTKSTILRFCQKVGYSGYTEFRYDCVKYVNSLSNAEAIYDQESSQINRIANIYLDTIKLMHYTIDDENMIHLAKLIKNARRVRLVGEINSSVTCYQMKYALAMYGIDSEVLNGVAEVKSIDLCANEDDLFIVFSVSSKTDIVKMAKSIKDVSQCKMALITMNAKTPLEQEVDSFVLLPGVAALKNQSLLDSVPIFSVFVEIILHYLNTSK